MLPPLPAGWKAALAPATTRPSFSKLQAFLDKERQSRKIFPAETDVFAALDLTPLDQVRVLILGQDPYPGEGHAHGLSFSVRPDVKKLPRSLVNIFDELRNDVGATIPNHGHLASWARQGVLLLNVVLTVQARQSNSHRGRGWEEFTQAIIQAVNAKSDPVVFVLWGASAQKKATFITGKQHTIVDGAHPSPLSARQGFFGSKPFSRTNLALKQAQQPLIDWQVPDL
jgi:uracil-DNA glycosylase